MKAPHIFITPEVNPFKTRRNDAICVNRSMCVKTFQQSFRKKQQNIFLRKQLVPSSEENKTLTESLGRKLFQPRLVHTHTHNRTQFNGGGSERRKQNTSNSVGYYLLVQRTQ